MNKGIKKEKKSMEKRDQKVYYTPEQAIFSASPVQASDPMVDCNELPHLSGTPILPQIEAVRRLPSLTR
jgi:hypothetical protein